MKRPNRRPGARQARGGRAPAPFPAGPCGDPARRARAAGRARAGCRRADGAGLAAARTPGAPRAGARARAARARAGTRGAPAGAGHPISHAGGPGRQAARARADPARREEERRRRARPRPRAHALGLISRLGEVFAGRKRWMRASSTRSRGPADGRHRRAHEPEAARGDPHVAEPQGPCAIRPRSGRSCASERADPRARRAAGDVRLGQAVRAAGHRRQRQRQDHHDRETRGPADRATARKVLLAAGDTFRAAATEQLEIWANASGRPWCAARKAPTLRR